jgi:hypothetical protein
MVMAKIFFLMTLFLSVLVKAQTPVATETVQTIVAPVPTPTPTPAPLPTPESLKVFGDFRYRHQSETQDPKQMRTMERFQARLGVNAQVEEDLKATIRLMTGSSATSGNQTMGDEKAAGMPRRTFGVDLAYFDYQPTKGLDFFGGKMPQPFIFAGKNQMLLDRDITPEGLALKYSLPLIEKELDFFIQGGSFWVKENYDDQFGEDKTDNMLNGGQLGLVWKPGEWTITAGMGSFAYTGLKDTPPTNITSGGKANGNTVDVNGNYPTNFDIEEKLFEIKKRMGTVDVILFGEMLENTDAPGLNKAQAYGVQLAYKNWLFSWSHEKVEKDAVVGLFTDSDFGGGVTSSSGQVWSLAYKLTKKVLLQYTVYNNENSIDVAPTKYDRSHLDLSMVF